MKKIKLAYEADGTVCVWKATSDSKHGGWVVTDHQGDKKFFQGCFDSVLDRMKMITFPNWGMKLLSVG